MSVWNSPPPPPSCCVCSNHPELLPLANAVADLSQIMEKADRALTSARVAHTNISSLREDLDLQKERIHRLFDSFHFLERKINDLCSKQTHLESEVNLHTTRINRLVGEQNPTSDSAIAMRLLELANQVTSMRERVSDRLDQMQQRIDHLAREQTDIHRRLSALSDKRKTVQK